MAIRKKKIKCLNKFKIDNNTHLSTLSGLVIASSPADRGSIDSGIRMNVGISVFRVFIYAQL